MKRRIATATALLLLTSFSYLTHAQAAQVTSGLLIDLNAANPNSYPGTGTTWIDLAGKDDTATLTNGPVYDTSTGAGFTNDGSNDYINIPSRAALQPSTTACTTMVMWAKVLSATNYDGIFGKMFASPSYDGYALLQSGTNALTLKMNGGSVDQTIASANNIYSFNTWTLFSFVTCFGGSTSRPSYIYVNSTVAITANNTDSSIPSPTAPIQLANGMQDGLEYSNIKVGAFAFYSRALTSQEISDSYDYYLNYQYVPEVSSVTLSTTGTPLKGSTFIITATVGTAGRVRFFANGKRIPNCLNLIPSGSPLTTTCQWKPITSGITEISAQLTPSNSGLATTTDKKLVQTLRRSNNR